MIRFVGEANTHWSETKKVTDEHGKEHDETEELTGHEEYFENHYYLVGAKSGNEITLPAGDHTYPFTCALPQNLPSSFEGEFGHVRYTIKVTLDRPWKFDQDTKMAFTVISPLDLNQNTRLAVKNQTNFFVFSFNYLMLNFPLPFNRSKPNWNWQKRFVASVARADRWKQS